MVPETFLSGVLVPIPKKVGCDTSNPKNWRPITICSIFSKVLELYILESCSDHHFHDLQFGFVTGRSTDMATTLLNDVVAYCKDGGNTVYTCSLDAEGVFDAIPHCILFQKAMGVLPDHCWHIMINWYCNLNVQIKWCGKYSTKIKIHVHVGTQQGGVSSPY